MLCRECMCIIAILCDCDMNANVEILTVAVGRVYCVLYGRTAKTMFVVGFTR